MKPKISIIIPVYNVQETLLRNCIESCLNQLEKSIEIIIVDDCSIDDSGRICDEYASKDSRVRTIHKSINEGLAAARNTGFYEAQGEWITFVDGDDWIEKDLCSCVDLSKVDKKIDLIFFGIYRDYGTRTEKIDFIYGNTLFSAHDCKKLQIDVLDYNKRLSTAYAKIIRKSYLYENNILHNSEVKCGIEGIEFNVRLFSKLSGALSVDKYLYHYVYNETSITGAPNHVTNLYVLLGLEAMQKYILGQANHEELYQQFLKRIHRVIYDTGIGSYFNPNYKISFKQRKSYFIEFLNSKVIRDVLTDKSIRFNSKVKNFIFSLIRYRLFVLLYLFGHLRLFMLRLK